MGIDNVLALRGDAIKSETNFIPEREGHAHADDLKPRSRIEQKGSYLHDEEREAAPTDLCIGAACYPEKHAEALNLNTDIAYLKRKVDAGAEYLVTQMFFDNAKYYNFVELCRAEGINVPIIPGIKPLTTLRHIAFIPKTFGIRPAPTLRSRTGEMQDGCRGEAVGHRMEHCSDQGPYFKERSLRAFLHYGQE